MLIDFVWFFLFSVCLLMLFSKWILYKTLTIKNQITTIFILLNFITKLEPLGSFTVIEIARKCFYKYFIIFKIFLLNVSFCFFAVEGRVQEQQRKHRQRGRHTTSTGQSLCVCVCRYLTFKISRFPSSHTDRRKNAEVKGKMESKCNRRNAEKRKQDRKQEKSSRLYQR